MKHRVFDSTDAELDSMLRVTNAIPLDVQLITTELQRRHLIHIGKETERLTKATQTLAASSDRLEKLTKKLKNLTWVLIVLTILATGVPIGIEIWKAKEVTPAKVVEPLPQNAPQTPTRPE